MAEDKSIFDYSFQDNELKSSRLAILNSGFKIYLVVICLLSILTGVKGVIYLTHIPESLHVANTIQSGVGLVSVTVMNLVGTLLIFLKQKKGVVILIGITIVKLAIYAFLAVRIAIDTVPEASFLFLPALLHIPALVYLTRRRKEWEGAQKRPEIQESVN